MNASNTNTNLNGAQNANVGPPAVSTTVAPAPPSAISSLSDMFDNLSVAQQPSADGDVPMDTSGQGPPVSAGAFTDFPTSNFRPGEATAPTSHRTNNHTSGNVRSAPYPTNISQAAAASAVLTSNNVISTGATHMGGAHAGGAGGVAPSHISAAPAAVRRAAARRAQRSQHTCPACGVALARVDSYKRHVAHCQGRTGGNSGPSSRRGGGPGRGSGGAGAGPSYLMAY
ncbi:unnamed protein product [Peniophora sp. CBMAI 1063]|nr:unnamed protein product [Peniophora sp. CBMAI 1063]